MRKYKGFIKWATLKKIFTSRDYKNHTAENGVYTINMQKSRFEIIPFSAKYLKVYQVGWK